MACVSGVAEPLVNQENKLCLTLITYLLSGIQAPERKTICR